MRLHMHLLPTYFPDLDPPFDEFYQNILEQVELADELGWDCFWFTEHHFALYGGPEPNPAVFLAAAAARTQRIHLGSAISILPLHHPITIAEDYAMVDVLSHGRLEFGMGLGNTGRDFDVHGVSRDESRDRFHEGAEIVTKAWSNERFSHEGAFWKFDDVTIYPRPVQQPHPPLWVAGHSPDSLGWAGRNGMNVMTVSHPYPPEYYVPGLVAWREGLIEAGISPRDRHCKLHVRVWVDENGERAKEVAEAALARYDGISFSTRGVGTYDASTYDWEGMLASGRNVYGTPDQCLKALEATMANFDFDILSTTFNFGGIPHPEVLKGIRLFAKEIMPALSQIERTMESRESTRPILEGSSRGAP